MYYIINFNTRKVLFMHSEKVVVDSWINNHNVDMVSIVIAKSI